MRGEAPQPGERRLQLNCRDGTPAELRIFEGKGRALLTRAGRTWQLRQQTSGSGIAYSDGRTTVRGKGRDITIETPGMEPVRCRGQSDSD